MVLTRKGGVYSADMITDRLRAAEDRYEKLIADPTFEAVAVIEPGSFRLFREPKAVAERSAAIKKENDAIERAEADKAAIQAKAAVDQAKTDLASATKRLASLTAKPNTKDGA